MHTHPSASTITPVGLEGSRMNILKNIWDHQIERGILESYIVDEHILLLECSKLPCVKAKLNATIAKLLSCFSSNSRSRYYSDGRSKNSSWQVSSQIIRVANDIN